jgi:methionyl-tRNA formyltransferase
LKVVALLNWGIGREVLDCLYLRPDVAIELVLTRWDHPCRDPWRNAVYDRASELGVPVQHGREWPDALLAERLRGVDLMVTHAWPFRFPEAVFSAPRCGSVNLHPSLLPRHRGPAPHLSVLQQGEAETGLTCHVIDTGLDTGPIVSQLRVSLQPGETVAGMLEKLKRLVHPVLELTLGRLQDPGFQPVPQDDARASYAPKLQRRIVHETIGDPGAVQL